MLAILVCHCANAETKARTRIKEAGVEAYLSFPCYTGKKSGEVFLESLPQCLKNTTDWKGALEMVQTSASYAIILGYDNNNIAWDNVMGSSLMNEARAEKIAETFA